MAHDLRADTALTPDPTRAGRFHANIPDAWKVVYVFGGVSMYAALRAMDEALDRPDLPLVTANAIFISPVPPGPITIDVDVLRNGRGASQVAADLRVPGSESPALRVHGVFGVGPRHRARAPRGAVPRSAVAGRHAHAARPARTRSVRSTSTSKPSGGR